MEPGEYSSISVDAHRPEDCLCGDTARQRMELKVVADLLDRMMVPTDGIVNGIVALHSVRTFAKSVPSSGRAADLSRLRILGSREASASLGFICSTNPSLPRRLPARSTSQTLTLRPWLTNLR